MKTDYILYEVMPDGLYNRKWVCCITAEDNGKTTLYRRERYVRNENPIDDERVKEELVNEVFDMFLSDQVNFLTQKYFCGSCKGEIDREGSCNCSPTL